MKFHLTSLNFFSKYQKISYSGATICGYTSVIIKLHLLYMLDVFNTII